MQRAPFRGERGSASFFFVPSVSPQKRNDLAVPERAKGKTHMFHCNECGISYPSAALLQNHRMKFCVASRVDVATQKMLRGEGPMPPPIPGMESAAYSTPSPHLFGAASALRRALPREAPRRPGQAYSADTPSPGFIDGAGMLPPLPRPSYANGGGGAGRMTPMPASSDAASFFPPDRSDHPVRSVSTEPYRGFQPPVRQSNGYAAQQDNHAAYVPSAPAFPHAFPATYGLPSRPGEFELYRVMEQQQVQLSAIQALLSGLSSGGGGASSSLSEPQVPMRPNLGAPRDRLHQLAALPSIYQNNSYIGNVIEGRYGLRVFAAEGLLAFHTVVDYTPINVAVRQYYCRRRIGSYLPELEQRDEYDFATVRTVSEKRRDGYVNFGRVEYIFNVVTANEIVLVVELLTKGRLIAWAEVLLESLGDKVRRLRHQPVDIAGVLRDAGLRSTTATIGLEVFRARWDEQEEQAPPPPPPAPRDEEPEGIPDPCTVFIDGIEGLPFNMISSRLVFYHIPKVDRVKSTGIGDPVYLVYQDPGTAKDAPVFSVPYECKLGDATVLVVVLESLEAGSTPTRVALGHLPIPMHKGTKQGCFITRLRRGPPDPEEILPLNDDYLNSLPCVLLKYRLEEEDRSKPYTPLVSLTVNERQIISERGPLLGDPCNPAGEDAGALFDDPGTPCRTYTDYSHLAPYAPQRGLFLKVEGLRGVPLERVLYKVVVSLNGKKVFTRAHDWKSDLGAPKFADEPYRFNPVPFSDRTLFYLFIYRMASAPLQPPEPVAWSVAQAFLLPSSGRNGRFTLPWFDGTPPDAFVMDATKSPVGSLVQEYLRNKRISYASPYRTITIAQGDPLRVDEFCKEYDRRAESKRLFMGNADPFPVDGTKDGMLGFPLAKVVDDGEAPPRYGERANRIFSQKVPMS